jgi:hypothetical protein
VQTGRDLHAADWSRCSILVKCACIGIAPANLRRLSVGDWTIDVIAYGRGGGYGVTVVP